MNNFLDAQADGLALALIVGLMGLVVLLVAIAIEAWRARGMRKRWRQREAINRYCESIKTQARWLASNTYWSDTH
jgi:hypothetical protein